MRSGLITVFLLCAALQGAGAQVQESQFAVRAVESLKKIFGDSIAAERRLVHLTPEEQQAVAERMRGGKPPDTLGVYVCTANAKVAGYGVIDNVKGKTQLITYLVAIRPDGVVADVDVLAYRESYGGEIAYDSFRSQFRNKSPNDEYQPGKDIKNISGATISVRAITFGTKRIAAAVNAVRGKLSK